MEKRKLIVSLSVAIGLILCVGAGAYGWKTFMPGYTQPSITFTSPLGGEAYVAGSTQTISWEAKNIPSKNKISITLKRMPPPPIPTEGQEFDPIIFSNLENTGSVSWTIADIYPTGVYVLRINNYESVPEASLVANESTSFTIESLRPVSDTWRTYETEKGGYSFRYPNDWNASVVQNNPKNALFGPGATDESGYGGVEFVGTLAKNQTLKSFVQKFNAGVESGSISEVVDTMGGQEVIISMMPKASLTEPLVTKIVSFENERKVFNVYMMYKTNLAQNPEDAQRLEGFNELLKTFSFK
jgi:hypothetical protein